MGQPYLLKVQSAVCHCQAVQRIVPPVDPSIDILMVFAEQLDSIDSEGPFAGCLRSADHHAAVRRGAFAPVGSLAGAPFPPPAVCHAND
jgi:hypothetical protein